MRLRVMRNLTPKQERAKERIIEIERQMRRCNNDDELFDLYCEADNIFNWHFETDVLMANNDYTPDHEKVFLSRQKYIEDREKLMATLVINGNVTVNGNVFINGKEARR